MKFLVALAFSVLCLSAWSADHSKHHPPVHHHPRPVYTVYPVYPVRPVYSVGQYYISGYYETRTETILVQPERIERQYVPPIFDTRHDINGNPVVVKVAEGYYRNIVIPARYENVITKVWVPGYWSSVPVRSYPPVVIEGQRSGFDLQFGIGQRGKNTSWGLNFGISE